MVVQQEPIQHYKAIILQLKVNFKKEWPTISLLYESLQLNVSLKLFVF